MPTRDIETIVDNLCQSRRKSSTEYLIVIILLSLLVVLTGILILKDIVFFDPYVAGKYGDHCYKRNYALEKPVYFRTLEDCLDFVSK